MIQNSPGPCRPMNRPSRRTTPRSHCFAIFGDCITTRPASPRATTGTGVSIVTEAHAPAARNPIRMATATMLRRGREMVKSESPPRRMNPGTMGCSFRAGLIACASCALNNCRTALLARVELADQLVAREACRRRVGEHSRHERAQPLRMLPCRSGADRRRVDERSDAAPRLEHAVALELGVDARDRVRVDLELDGQLPYRRQLIAGAQAARGNRRAQAAIELRIDRRAIPGVDGNDGSAGHVLYCTSSLIQVNQKKAPASTGACRTPCRRA